MEALYKMIASFLSVTLIFTSVVPSFAQARSNSPFKVSASNALGDAINRHVTQTLEKAEDAYWVERGTKLVATQQRVVTLPYIVDILKAAKEKAPKQDILQAQVCDKENQNCVPALAYAWGGIHYAVQNLLYFNRKYTDKNNLSYHKVEPVVETAPHLATLITEYGLHSEQDRQAVRTYFYKLIKEADSDCDSGFMKRYLEVGSESNRADARRANELQAKRCQAEVSVLPALAMIEKTPYEKQLAAKEIYSLLKDRYDQDQGAEVMYSAVTALGILDTEQAYRYLDRFLTQDTIPSVAGNVWEGLWSPGKSTAQNSLRAASNIRGGNSRYLNRINEQFQYLDKAEAARQGFNNTAWQSEGRQYPYGNVLEEIGVFLGQQSKSSAFAKNLAKKMVAKANEAAKSKTNAAGTLHYPVVLGILDGWRAHGKQFIFVPDYELLLLFYKGDWFDINEGTQRRIHHKAYQFAKARGWTWQAPVFDKEKNKRYIYNARILGIGQAADVVAPLLVAEGLFSVVPALAEGIPSAVRTLRAHKAWVGTKNYLKNAKVAKPVAKEVPLKPAPAAQQVTPKSTKSAQLSVAKVDNNTVQILPKGYTVEQLNPGRTNIAPKTFASTGDGVAPGKPLSNAKQAKADKFQYKSQRQQDKRIYKEAEEMMQPAQTAPAAPRTLSWKDKARFQWEANFKPAFQNLFKFGTSRYGLSALGTGAAPVTSEAAIMANTPVIAQTVRAQQSTFIAEKFLRGGAGASYRVGAVNPGALALQNSAKTAATLVNLNPVTPFMKAAASVALTVGGGYTAAQMGLLPTDGSELVRLAMLPGLVVIPGMIKPMLQMPFNGPVGGNGGAGVVRPKRLRIGQTPQFQKLKAAGAVQTQVAQAEPESRQVANGGKVVVNTPQAVPVQAQVLQVESGTAVKHNQLTVTIPSFTSKLSGVRDEHEAQRLIEVYQEDEDKLNSVAKLSITKKGNTEYALDVIKETLDDTWNLSKVKRSDNIVQVMNTLDGMKKFLGYQGNFYNRWFYSGETWEEMDINDMEAEQFHIVQESLSGFPTTPFITAIKKLASDKSVTLEYDQNHTINAFAFKGQKITIVYNKQGNIQQITLPDGKIHYSYFADLAVAIQSALKEELGGSWRTRMGAHELEANDTHIHFENIVPNKTNAMFTSYVLNIGVTRTWSNYGFVFSGVLNPEGLGLLRSKTRNGYR